ncbi:MAG: hypothetical protein ACXACH_07065 [Candidatus Hermodarchaeia archaeon]
MAHNIHYVLRRLNLLYLNEAEVLQDFSETINGVDISNFTEFGFKGGFDFVEISVAIHEIS